MPNDAPAGKVRLMLQIDVPADADTSAIFALAQERFAGLGFEVDQGYRPVRIRVPPAESRGGAEASSTYGQGITSAQRQWPDQPPATGSRTVVLRGRIPREHIPTLRSHPDVRSAAEDVRLRPFRRIGVDCARHGHPIGDVKLLARKLGADRIWAEGYDGRGVVVGVVDAGLTARGRIVNPTEIPVIPWPPAVGRVTNGHPHDWGTTAVGWGQHGNMMAFDIQAIAPAATLWDIRIWEPGGDFETYLSNAISGYRHAIESHRLSGEPHILSNSWGLYNRADDPDGEYGARSPFTMLVEEALDEGILVLFAAGNCGQACPFDECRGDTGPNQSILGPNGHPRVLTVGAADLEDELCGYSSQGPSQLYPTARKPDFCSYTRFGGFFPSADPVLRDFDGGTSAATAVAAGVVALLKHRRPDLTQDEARAVLGETAESFWASGFDRDSGAGIIRAKAAFDLL